MKDHYAAIRDLGGEVLVVSFTQPRQVVAYLERYPLPFLVVSDPERTAYRAFSLDRTGWSAFFRPWVLARYFALMFRGWLPKKSDPEEDLLQLGGDFILDRRGRLAYAFRGKEPTDRPSFQALLEAMRAAADPKMMSES